MSASKFIGHILPPEQPESEPFVSEQRQRVGKVKVMSILERIDELEGCLVDPGPGGDLDV